MAIKVKEQGMLAGWDPAGVRVTMPPELQEYIARNNAKDARLAVEESEVRCDLIMRKLIGLK